MSQWNQTNLKNVLKLANRERMNRDRGRLVKLPDKNEDLIQLNHSVDDAQAKVLLGTEQNQVGRFVTW